ncbi:MAG: NADH-quinone oxidoreductase subunit G [Alphaproteobacteria bacterium]|nr:MAG: NADH-quinone oxidoreductase subunit G [Alphaproteobacteria bacterium]
MSKKVRLTIDRYSLEVPAGIPLIEAASKAGVEIPHFCYHPRLNIAGNCRMCLVEIQGRQKLAASCTVPVENGMVVYTNTRRVRQGREGVLEFLLINHPLDCPICDQGGACDLQDITVAYGRDRGRYGEDKRAVPNKPMGPLIKTEMNRCIHCMRCVRFVNDVAGVPEMGAYGRGEKTQIVTYLNHAVTSELSGNTIDLCPVGALTSKPYAFKGRPWELVHTPSIDIMDGMGAHICIDSCDGVVKKIVPRVCEPINEEWITDKIRFSYDGLHYQRIDTPYIRAGETLVPASWNDTLVRVSEVLHKAKRFKRVGALAGKLSDLESMYSLKKVLHNLGIEHMDCREQGNRVSAKDESHFCFNDGFARIGDADVLVIVGDNLRACAPLLQAKIFQAHHKSGTKIYYIGSLMGARWDMTVPYTHVSTSLDILKGIADGEHPLCAKLTKASAPMMIVLDSCFVGDSARHLQACLHAITDKYLIRQHESGVHTGYNVLSASAAQTGGLMIGFVPFDEGSPRQKNMDHDQIIAAAESGQLDVLILNEYDECHIRPHASCFVIYVGHHGDRGAEIADVIMPSVSFAEKCATYVNSEGRVQKTQRAIAPPGFAREGWIIWRDVLHALGGVSSWQTLDDLQQMLIEEFPSLKRPKNEFSSSWRPLRVSKDTSFSGNLTVFSVSLPREGYYVDNVIARHSRTMRACHIALDLEAGTASEVLHE